MKKQLDLHKEIAKRNYKKPFPLFYLAYYIACKTNFIGGKYKPHYHIIDNLKDCKGPAFLIWNHQSRRDHALCTVAAWPRRINIVCAYNEFFRSHLRFALKHGQILPKKVYCNDFAGIRAMNDIIKRNGVVAFSPEGTSSITGENQPIVPGTGNFLKHYKIPVYFQKFTGSYLTNTKHCEDDRIGRIDCTLSLLFKPEDLERMSGEEIEDKINEAFRVDDYALNKIQRVEYKSNGKICTNLQDLCYKCPRCGAELKMDAKDDWIKCQECGNGAHMNDYYDFIPFDDSCIIPESPSQWVRMERQDVIREIRKDPKFVYSEFVKIGEIPSDHYLKDKKTGEICGEGFLTIDHNGVHFKGTRKGNEWSFDLTYKEIYTFSIVTDCTYFSFFVKGEYIEFYPQKRDVIKMLLLTEEMHRLHVNTWKNFKWMDYMYENVECAEGIVDETKNRK